MANAKRLRRSRPVSWENATAAASRFHKCSLVALLMSSPIHAAPSTAAIAAAAAGPLQSSPAFMYPRGGPAQGQVLPRCCRDDLATNGIPSRSRGIPCMSGGAPAGDGDDVPLPAAEPAKRGRGRPKGSGAKGTTASGRGRGRGGARNARGTGRARGRGGPTSEKYDERDSEIRQRVQENAAADIRRLEEFERHASEAAAVGGAQDDRDAGMSEFEELEMYAEALARHGELEDSKTIRRQLDELNGLATRKAPPLTEAELEERIQQQLLLDREADDERGDAEVRRLPQDIDGVGLLEEEMGLMHGQHRLGQQPQPPAGQRAERNGAEELFKLWNDEHGAGGDSGMNGGGKGEAGFPNFVGRAEGDDGGDLPSVESLLANVDALLGEEEFGSTRSNTVTDLDVEDEFEPMQEDEETTLMRQMPEESLSRRRDLRQVMVVIGKHLVRDQVTVEYASRIRRLVQGLKSGRLRPDLVCFTGGRVRDNNVADASAGYIFFRHLCEQQGVDTFNIGFLVESESTCTKEAMTNVVREVSRLGREEIQDMAEEEKPRTQPRQKYHFTLISNEYHLSRVIMVHEISENVSLLSPLKQLHASWGYEHVPYPYACYDDENKEFQADVYKTLEELVPLQVNVQAVARREEFFQEENYASLTYVRGRVNDFIRQVHSSRGPLARHMNLMDLQRAAEQGRRGKMGTFPAGNWANLRLDEALEWAKGALAKIHEIIEPAATRRDSVSLRAWAMCAALLEKAILQGQMAADPDRPLYPHEWGVLEDEKPPRDPRDDGAAAPVRARETIHELLEEEGARYGGRWGSKTRRNVFYWEGAEAAAELGEEGEHLLKETPGWKETVDSILKEQNFGRRGDEVDGEEGLGDPFEEGGSFRPTVDGLRLRGPSRDELSGERDARWSGDGGETPSAGKAARAKNARTREDATRWDGASFELESDRRSVGVPDDVGPSDDDLIDEMIRLQSAMDGEQPEEPRVNWALPRARRRKPLPPPPPPPLLTPTPSPPPMASKPKTPATVGRPRAAGAKAARAKANGTSANGASANGARAKPRVNGARVKPRVTGVRAKLTTTRTLAAAAGAGGTAASDEEEAEATTPPKRRRGRPRLSVAEREARDD